MDHHHIDTVTAVTPSADFSGLHFTRSATGHVHSMFWSYDWKAFNPRGPYHIGSHFHALRERSIAAFAGALGISEHQVMVTVRENPVDGALEWRCGSQHPVERPKPKIEHLKKSISIDPLKLDAELGADFDAHGNPAIHAPEAGFYSVNGKMMKLEKGDTPDTGTPAIDI